PGITWFDVDRDGDEDLIVGAAKGGHVTLFRNDAGRFSAAGFGPAAPSDMTTILGLAEPGRTRLVAGLSTWEDTTVEQMKSTPAVVSLRADRGTLGLRIDSLVASHETATGPLAMAD